MSDATKPSGLSRLFKWGGGLLLLLILLVLLAPTIIAKTPLRDALINSALSNEGVVVSTGRASFGYFSPLHVHELDVKSTNGAMNLTIDNISTDRSWLVMLLEKDDLGTFRFEKPDVEVVTGIAPPKQAEAATTAQPAAKSPPPMPKLVAEITDAGVRVRNVGAQDPAVQLENIDFTVRVEPGAQGARVVVDPTTILDNEVLTPELCGQGLHLIAPIMADVVDVEGKVSFRLDRCIVPVGEMDEEQRVKMTEIAGAVELADVTVGLNNKIMELIVPLLNRIGRSDAPTKMTVNRASAVEFSVVEGRVQHRGLVMQMPLAGSALEIQSSGSVGMDESLDIQLAVSLPDDLLGGSALAKFLTDESVLVQVTGTLEEPKLSLNSEGGWTKRLHDLLGSRGDSEEAAVESPRGQEELADPDSGNPRDGEAGADETMRAVEDLSDSVLGIVDGLLERSGDRQEQDHTPGLRDRIRTRRDDSEGRRRLFPRLRRERDSEPEPDAPQPPAEEPTEI